MSKLLAACSWLAAPYSGGDEDSCQKPIHDVPPASVHRPGPKQLRAMEVCCYGLRVEHACAGRVRRAGLACEWGASTWPLLLTAMTVSGKCSSAVALVFGCVACSMPLSKQLERWARQSVPASALATNGRWKHRSHYASAAPMLHTYAETDAPSEVWGMGFIKEMLVAMHRQAPTKSACIVDVTSLDGHCGPPIFQKL